MDKERLFLENFPTSESAKRQLSYVTAGFYDNSYVGKWLFQVMGQEYDDARLLIGELPLQMFPETATWGLKYHEIKWGLPVRENLSYEERRRLIYAKRDYRAPMTPYRMEKYLEDVTGFEVHIADVHDLGEYGFSPPHPNVFKAFFIGEGTLDSRLIHRILNRLKQSHTMYTVNERIEAVFDNRKLEQMILGDIRFKIGLPFWYEYVFNGGWLLDGSITLGQKRRYGLALAVKYRAGFCTECRSRLVPAAIRASVLTTGSAAVGAWFRSGIPFWDAECLDGSWLLDGSRRLNAGRYGMAVDITGSFRMEEGTGDIGVDAVCTSWSQTVGGDAAATAEFHLSADFRTDRHPGDSAAASSGYEAGMAVETRVEMDFSNQEAAGNLTVETKTRDHWFMDGSFRLDGARGLDSVYRQEAIE